MKFVNNRWVPAAGDANGEGDLGGDGVLETYGDVAPGIYNSTTFGESAAAREFLDEEAPRPWRKSLHSVKLFTGEDENVYLSYVDYKLAEERATGESENNLRVLKLVVTDGISSWQAMPSLALQNVDDLEIGAENIDVEVDSVGNMYALLNKVIGTSVVTVRWWGAITRLVRLPAGADAWSIVGDPFTSVGSDRYGNLTFPAEIAISPTNQLYLAMQYTLSPNVSGQHHMHVLSLNTDDTWTILTASNNQFELRDIGAQARNSLNFGTTGIMSLDISDSGKIYLTMHSRGQRLNMATWDPMAESPAWRRVLDLPTTKLNEIFEVPGRAAWTAPVYTQTQIDKNDIPYIAFKNPLAGGSGTTPLIIMTLRDTIDDSGEIVKEWRGLTIPFSEMTSTGVPGDASATYINLQLGLNDRPHVLYRDGGADGFSRYLVAEVENTNDLVQLSITEQEFFASGIDLEVAYDDIWGPNVTPDVEWTWNVDSKHYDYFDPIELEKGIIKLNSTYTPNGASFRFPFLLVDGYAKQGDEFSHTKDENGEEVAEFATFKVNFVPSPDPDVVAAREFAFGSYNCEPDGDTDENTCTITMAEGEELLFNFIQSKVQSFTLTGTLPEGMEFVVDETDPTNQTASFAGKTSYSAAAGIDAPGVYEFSVTGSSDGSSSTVQMTINVTNVLREVTADYNVTLNELEQVSLKPTSALAVQSYSLELDGEISWIRMISPLTGQVDFAPGYRNAGIYTGVVYAHGFDEPEPEAFPFTVEVVNVPMSWAVGNTINIDMLEGGIQNTTYDSVAVQRFYLKTVDGESLPDFLRLNPSSGQVIGTAGWEDEGESYKFTVVAEGYDGEYKELVHYLSVFHADAPPIIEATQGAVTEGLNPVSVDLLSQIYDFDGDGYKNSYGDSVYMVEQQYIGDTLMWSHTGKGTLEITANGFIYTPYTPVTESEVRPVDDMGEDELITLYRPDADLEALNLPENREEKLTLIDEIVAERTSPDDGLVVVTFNVRDGYKPTGLIDDPATAIDESKTANIVQSTVPVVVNAIKEQDYKQTSKAGSLGNILALLTMMLLVRVYKRKA
jgi:hypothetical protein